MLTWPKLWIKKQSFDGCNLKDHKRKKHKNYFPIRNCTCRFFDPFSTAKSVYMSRTAPLGSVLLLLTLWSALSMFLFAYFDNRIDGCVNYFAQTQSVLYLCFFFLLNIFSFNYLNQQIFVCTFNVSITIRI